ncbi:MAG: hypothetical protein ACXVA9_02865 [Bdellovibrionales bacterium]
MRWFSALVVFCLTQNLAARETPDFNRVQMRGGIEIQLNAEPSEPEQLEKFQKLTPEEKQSFYERRNFLVRKLTAIIAFPRTIGGIAWTKNTVKDLFNRARGRAEPEDSSGEPALSLKDHGKEILETMMNVFVDKMWADASYVANASSVGFTLYAGPVINTSLWDWGFFWGRGISVDIGHDFTTEKGYIRVYYDKQSLSTAGLSADVGVMFDFLIHFSDVPEAGSDLAITHYKLPVFGCYRQGESYRAFGAQIGIHALEFVAVAIAYDHPQIAAYMLLGARAIGTATIYSTHLTRKFIVKASVPAKWVKRLIGQSACESLLEKSQ